MVGALRNIIIGDKAARVEIMKFSLPIISELLLLSLISLVNLSMVGGLGPYAISAVGLTQQPIQIALAVFQSFYIGATALISRFIGGGEYDNAKTVVIQTCIIAVLMGIVTSIPCFIFARELMVFVGAQADTIEPATTYMRYVSVGLFFQAIPIGVASILRGAGHTKEPMIYNIMANIVNVALCLVLIDGRFFFPQLGLIGAAVASICGNITACVMSIIILFRSEYPLNLSLKDKIRPDKAMIRRIMRLSTSSAGEQFVTRLGFLIYGMTVARLGTIPLAAHQISNNVSMMVMNITNGLSISASSFTGRSLGAKDTKKAELYIKESLMIGLIVMALASAVYFFYGGFIASFFTDSEEVISTTANLLKIVTFLMFAQAVQMILSGGLRGAGDTLYPFISSLIGILGIRSSLVLLFVNVFMWGVEGAWYAAIIDQAIRAVLYVFRYRNGKWKYMRV